MKKLHLTSFVFTTGENEYKEQRLVVAETTEHAYIKALDWFLIEFPESKLISCISHEAIEEATLELPKVPSKKELVHEIEQLILHAEEGSLDYSVLEHARKLVFMASHPDEYAKSAQPNKM